MNAIKLSAAELAQLLINRIQQPYCQRILHGRGKKYAGYEHVNIEWYPPYLFVQNFNETLSDDLNHALKAVFEKVSSIDAVLIQSREWPDFVTQSLFSRKEVELPLVYKAPLSKDLHCEIKLGANRNTGTFLDMRGGWQWIAQNSENKRVLNLFSYTCVFSLFALSGGATWVDNVDMAANVLKIGQRNHQSNKLHDGKSAFIKRDILKSQSWFKSREPYDLIVLDPPPYQKKAFRGWQDYLKLLRYAQHGLKPGGTLLCCLNHPQVSIEQFMADLNEYFDGKAKLEVIARAPEIEELEDEKGLKLITVTL